MKTAFDQNLCLAWLKKGRLRPAMEYLAQFPEQAELYRKRQHCIKRAWTCIRRNTILLMM